MSGFFYRYRWSAIPLFDLHHRLNQLLSSEIGGIVDARLVGIDGVNRIVEQFGYLRVVINPQSNERKDTQLGVQQFVGFENNLLIGFKQLIKLLNESGIDMQKHRIKTLVEIILQHAHVCISWDSE